MNKTLLLPLLVCLFVSNAAQGQDAHNHKRTFYIVRHAEKDTGTNPAISVKGKQRAGDLYGALKRKDIDLIMFTQYRRTAMTGDSLRIYQQVDTLRYQADERGAMFGKTVAGLPGRYKNILVVGHSNTVPAILKQLGAIGYAGNDLPDHEYDNLFVVKRKKGRAVLQSKKYGAVSLQAGGNQRMNILQ